MALKEWASVLLAIERGQQLVLIRKGGLIEPGSGFELASPAFVLYPTFEHQTVNFLRPEARGLFDEALRGRPPEGEVPITLLGIATASVASHDPQIVERLSAFHVYNDAFMSQRLKWQPQQPLVIVTLRAFKLPSPYRLAASPRYAGCRSWVELEAPIPLQGAQPVLDDMMFEQRLAALTPLLAAR
jgi:hypothetical protein